MENLNEPMPTIRPGARFISVYLLPGLVLVVALVSAVIVYGRFLPVSRALFDDPGEHDRNAHCWLGLCMGLDLRHGDIGHLLYHIHKARTWPPLHPLLVGAVTAIGGPDFRLAVLPSLGGWVCTALFGFLLARRAVPRGGNLAGLVAALFILSSPALKAYATDIMLESLGACLSLLVLYLYVRTVQEPSAWMGRLLAVALTALFFQKYNYWLLVLGAVAAAEMSARGRIYRDWLGALLRRWRPWLVSQLRHPLNYLLALALAVLVGVYITGPLAFTVAGRSVSVQAGGLLLEIPYMLLFARVALWWWQRGRTACAGLSETIRPLIYWHAWPVAIWLLWPQRLSYFLWYTLCPHGAMPENTIAHGLFYYWACLRDDYHLATLSVVVAVALAMLVLAGRRWLRPGGQVVLWFLLVACLLTARHPNQKSRFLNSWIPGTWVAAGMGLAFAIYGPTGRRWQPARPWLAAGAATGIALLQLPGFLAPGHSPEGGPHLGHGSALDMTDWYLPQLAGSRQPTVLANIPMTFQTWWTGLLQYGPQLRFETDVDGFHLAGTDRRACLEHWLATTPSDRLVFMETPNGFDSYAAYSQLGELLSGQTRFALVEQRDFPEHGCRVSVWRRAPAATAAVHP
jgi:hypothetical protein